MRIRRVVAGTAVWMLAGQPVAAQGGDVGSRTACEILLVNKSSRELGLPGLPVISPADSARLAWDCSGPATLVAYDRPSWAGSLPNVAYREVEVWAGPAPRLELTATDFEPWPSDIVFPAPGRCVGTASRDLIGMVIPDPTTASLEGVRVGSADDAGAGVFVDAVGRFRLACVTEEVEVLRVSGDGFEPTIATAGGREGVLPLRLRAMPYPAADPNGPEEELRCESTRSSRESSALLMAIAGFAFGGLIGGKLGGDWDSVFHGAAIGAVVGAFFGSEANRRRPPCRRR